MVAAAAAVVVVVGAAAVAITAAAEQQNQDDDPPAAVITIGHTHNHLPPRFFRAVCRSFHGIPGGKKGASANEKSLLPIPVYRAVAIEFGGAAAFRFPRGEAVTKIGPSQPILVTEEECGHKS